MKYKKSIQEIQDSFNADMRLFAFYQEDMHKSIKAIQKQVTKLQEHIVNGGSIEVKPTVRVDERGKQVMTMGIADNPDSRATVQYALENRLKQTRGYVDISLAMALSHLISIFDAKYLEIYLRHIETVPAHPDSLKTPEERVIDFSYKTFTNQVASCKQNAKIDFEKVLGKGLIQELAEICETRNLYIHNNGIVNEKYTRNVPSTTLKIGSQRPLTVDYFDAAKEAIEKFFASFAFEFDKKLRHI